MKYGYVRQTLDTQYFLNQINEIQSIKEHDISEILIDVISGGYPSHEVLDELLTKVQAQDTIIVKNLSTFGKTLNQLSQFLLECGEKEVTILTLDEKYDTSSSEGKVFCETVHYLAKVQKDISTEKTSVGLISAKKKGHVGGRPRVPKEKIDQIAFLYQNKNMSLRAIAAACNVSIGTAYKYAIKENQ